MEAKRIKLSPSTTSSSQSSSNSPAHPSYPSPSCDRTYDLGDEEKLKTFIKNLRRQLSNKQNIILFLKKSDGRFKILVDIFVRTANDLGSTSPNEPPVHLKDVTSLIANCCNYSVAACLELKQPHLRFSYVAVKILESSAAPIECKHSLIRMVANMCAHKETALFISSSSALVDKISQFLVNENPDITKQSLRVLRLLSEASFTRVLILSNAGFYLGKLFADEDSKYLKEVTALLSRMCVRYVADTGRQLASSDCSNRLVSLIFSNENDKIKTLIVQLCQGSSDIRDRLSESNLINRLVDEAIAGTNNNTQLHCTLLSTFAQDAWGRATLRKNGALDLLVERFAKSKENSERLSTIQSLKHFIHDTAGMAHLVRSALFLDTIISDVQSFVNDNTVICIPMVKSEDDYFRPDSPLLMEIESSLRRQSADNSEPNVLYKTFYYAPPESFSPSPLSSPPYSSPSNEGPSPIHSTSTSPGLSYMATSVGDTASSSVAEEQRTGTDVMKERKHIIDAELWLITWQAQEDSNIPFLIREDLVIEIIRYLSLVPRADFRAGRALKRMASSRTSIDTLLQMQFHIRVHDALCEVPCRTARFAKRCNRCEKCVEVGKEILREFSSHVDSGYGDSFLVQRIRSDSFVEKLQAAIAKVLLLKDTAGARRRNMSSLYSLSINILFSSFEEMLRRSKGACALELITYTNGPYICSQIVYAVSRLISNRRAREILEIDEPYNHPESVPCLLAQYNSSENHGKSETSDEELLTFTTESDEVIIKIPLSTACENSGYFQGMFSANLAEKTSNQRVFKFDPISEGCSVEDFVCFLHFLSGCRDRCSRISSASSCKALINLADRYICTSLSEWICDPHGPAMSFLNGETVPVILSLALLTEMYPRLLSKCFLTIVKYCSPGDILETFVTISSSPVLITSFIKSFREFLGE